MLNKQNSVSNDEILNVKSCDDFDINGNKNQIWESTKWVKLGSLDNPPGDYETKFKMLYSQTGIYILAHCEDTLISTSFTQDQDDIWEGDVFETFFQTDPENPLYFEYEVNPLGAELAILVPNNQGEFIGWAPWHYEKNRMIKKVVNVNGGVQKPGEKITSWTAELFIPFALFKGLKNVPAKPGTRWKANFFRMDYDTGKRMHWGWKPIETNFHDYKNYGTIVFE